MRHGTRPVTLRTRWLTIDEGGHVSNSSSIYGTRPVKILWSMLPPLKLLNSSGPTRIPSYLKSNSTVCRPGDSASGLPTLCVLGRPCSTGTPACLSVDRSRSRRIVRLRSGSWPQRRAVALRASGNFPPGISGFCTGGCLGAQSHDAPSKLVGRYGLLLPFFRLVGVHCIAALWRVKSLLRHRSDRPKLTDRSFDLEIHRRCFAAALFDLILDVLPFIERAQSRALDRGHVDEHLRLNESVALGRIEPQKAHPSWAAAPCHRRCYVGAAGRYFVCSCCRRRSIARAICSCSSAILVKPCSRKCSALARCHFPDFSSPGFSGLSSVDIGCPLEEVAQRAEWE